MACLKPADRSGISTDKAKTCVLDYSIRSTFFLISANWLAQKGHQCPRKNNSR